MTPQSCPGTESYRRNQRLSLHLKCMTGQSKHLPCDDFVVNASYKANLIRESVVNLHQKKKDDDRIRQACATADMGINHKTWQPGVGRNNNRCLD